MKAPHDLAYRLGRQWESADLRETRLLRKDGWPIVLSIGRPSAQLLKTDVDAIRAHLQEWRRVKAGQVVWQPSNYRAASESIEVPSHWVIRGPSEWVEAIADRRVTKEFEKLSQLLERSNELFHPTFVRQRALWKDHTIEEMLQVIELANLLGPGCANGVPLRSVSLAGIDSKFFERHRGTLIRLLDLRFDDEISRQGLETFLDARQEGDHWLLVADLDGKLLPFPRQRVLSRDLVKARFLVSHVVVVENEQSLHQLPRLSNCIAVLGAGNNLSWIDTVWVQNARVGYWGDIDTWGLTMLARARSIIPDLTALLMSRAVFDEYANRSAVPEPIPAGATPPAALLPSEKQLYSFIALLQKGRLEQEFLPKQIVTDSFTRWISN